MVSIVDAYRKRKYLLQRTRQLRLIKRFQKELDRWFYQYLSDHMIPSVTELELQRSRHAYFIKLHDYYIPYYKKLRYLGDINWVVHLMETVDDISIEVVVTITNASPKYIQTFRFIYTLEECFKEKTVKWLGTYHVLDMTQIMRAIENETRIYEYIKFIIDQYKTKGGPHYDRH
jgi:hypothetical protein